MTGAHDDFTHEDPKKMETLIRGGQHEYLLQLIRDFTVFRDKGYGPFKIVGEYHQFLGARKAFVSIVETTQEDGDRKVGGFAPLKHVGRRSLSDRRNINNGVDVAKNQRHYLLQIIWMKSDFKYVINRALVRNARYHAQHDNRESHRQLGQVLHK